MTALAIVAITLSIGLPSFARTAQRTHAETAMQLLSTDMVMARNSAISRGTQIVMCPRDTLKICRKGGNWEAGWIIFIDPDGNLRPDTKADLLRSDDSPGDGKVQITSSSGRPLLRFQSDGRSAGSNLSVRLCVDHHLVGQVIVNNVGRVRTARSNSAQPCPMD